ncbi:MAG TPA: cytochrome D1 domain-containing protein [Steroidobacteraceae bacterium]|jgi:YVTN family beta-propeller protein
MYRLPATLLLAAAALTLGGPANAARAYVSNEDDGTITVIEVESLEAVATLEVGKRPRGMVLSRDGRLLYVAVSGMPKCPPPVPDEECEKLPRDRQADGVVVIDTTALKVLRRLEGATDPERVELSRDGGQLFVTDEDDARLTVIDTRRGTVLARIKVGREPEGVRASPDGRWVLVTSEGEGSVAIVDAHRHRVLRTVMVGARPRDIAFSRDGRSAYVPGEADASLYRIAIPGGAQPSPVLKLRKEARPMGVVLDAARARLYMSTGRGGSVAVVALPAATLQSEIAVGGRPWGIALSPDGQRLLTANGPAGDVAVIDAGTLTVLGKVKAGHGPWGVAVGP